MNLPQPDDYIDIHTHGATPSTGVFIIENLMAHEVRRPGDMPGTVCSFGIHPWYLNEDNFNPLLRLVNDVTCFPNLVAVGEAGFDRLRGPSMELQRRAFDEQVKISELSRRPLVIHCVRAWEEIFLSYKKLRPSMPWLIHGFRGNATLAEQLLSKGIYLSFWFDFVMKPESAELLRSIPGEKMFLETDGADIDIRDIYCKVSRDLDLSVVELKKRLQTNYKVFFKI
jgi:TatD DNase family protein